jgi:flagellar hook-associated protein 2
MAVSSILSASQITSLIQQASAAYQAPAAALQIQEQPIQAKVQALGQVQGALNSLQSALASLANVQTLTQRTVSVTPSGVVQANATNDAAAGTYNLSGIHLAQAESLISSGSASSSGTLGSGAVQIKVGGGSTVTVNISDEQSSLTGIASAITAANAGVQATVLFDGAQYHLVLTGATGAANAFTVTGTGALAGLSYHAGASGGTSGLSATQTAANASFSLNGFTITSGSNTISGAVPGLSLTLAASGAATVTVSQSASALSNAAQSLVGAFNQAVAKINQLSAYSPVSGAGPLLGDVGLQIVRLNLLNAISTPITVGTSQSSRYTSLSSVGFSVTSGGTITFDQSVFQKAAATDYAAVAALLGEIGQATNASVTVDALGAAKAGTYAVVVSSNAGGTLAGTVNGQAASGTGGLLVVNGSGPAQGLALKIAGSATGRLGSVTVSQGLFGSLSSILSAALDGATGSITGEIANLNKTLTSLNQQIAALQQQAQKQTQALTAQFSVAQARLSQLETVSSFLTTYFNLPTSGSGG